MKFKTRSSHVQHQVRLRKPSSKPRTLPVYGLIYTGAIASKREWPTIGYVLIRPNGC